MFSLKIEDNKIILECKNKMVLRILRRMLCALDDLKEIIKEVSEERKEEKEEEKNV